jgi:hypothetical protein
MAVASDYYFVRVNGRTAHNDPAKVDCYVEGEPPVYPATAYDYAEYCLRYDVVRLGWPGAGDLRRGEDVPDATPCYGTFSDHVRGHLREFRSIPVGAGVLMPDRQRLGVIYAGDVTLPYSYFFEIPAHPFECAHRVGVRWDLDPATGRPMEYRAEDLGITTRGGWWLWALHRLTSDRHADLVARIDSQRRQRRQATPEPGAS